MEELGRGDTLAFYKSADGFAFNRTETLEQIASGTSAEFILLYTRPSEVKVGRFAIARMLAVAADTGADMVYADHYDAVDSVNDDLSRLVKHPLIDCQKGALRDDFDFGGLLLFRTSSFKDAVRKMVFPHHDAIGDAVFLNVINEAVQRLGDLAAVRRLGAEQFHARPGLVTEG